MIGPPAKKATDQGGALIKVGISTNAPNHLQPGNFVNSLPSQMGTCFSKKPDPPLNHPQSQTLTLKPQTQTIPNDKKSVFVIKHRNSHDAETPKSRLSRSSSAARARKLSLDLDDRTLVDSKSKQINDGDGFEEAELVDCGDDVSLAERIRRHRRSRSSGNSGRRVSRSPSRRSESPVSGTTSASSNIGANNNNNVNNRPGKMVSVPATVGGDLAVKRISVRRNVGVSSPRGRSPAKRGSSLSRSNSKREEYSPYRRNALGDIDQNCSGNEAQIPYQKTNGENLKSNKFITQGGYSGPLKSIATEDYLSNNKAEKSQPMTADDGVRTEVSIADNLKQQTTTRRSPRLSRNLDLNPCSYTALLLEDIQNFHQKNAPSVALPYCVSKAQSIVDAVADLNSGTRSNFYANLSDQRRKNSTPVPCHVSDDQTDPTFHKYVTVKRGTMDVEEEEEESSGSNSFVSGNQHWVSSSSWEPNSSDSTGYCTSSRSNTKEEKTISMGSKGHTRNISESTEEKKREPDQQRSGIGRYRVGS